MAHRTKLEQPDRDRSRVRELAKQLSIDPATLLEHIRASGEYVPSIHSFLEMPVVLAIRAHFGVADVVVTPEVRPWGPGVPRPGDGLTAPSRRSSRDNNPFRIVESEGQVADRGIRGKVAAYTSERAQPPDYTAAMAFEASDAMKDWEWSVRGLSEVERDAWLAEGLSDRQAKFAADCHDAGLTPAELSVDVYGSSVLFRITHGESAGEVARLLRRARGVS